MFSEHLGYVKENKIIGCISIAAPIFNFTLDDVDRLGLMAKEVADEISKSMEKEGMSE